MIISLSKKDVNLLHSINQMIKPFFNENYDIIRGGYVIGEGSLKLPSQNFASIKESVFNSIFGEIEISETQKIQIHHPSLYEVIKESKDKKISKGEITQLIVKDNILSLHYGDTFVPIGRIKPIGKEDQDRILKFHSIYSRGQRTLIDDKTKTRIIDKNLVVYQDSSGRKMRIAKGLFPKIGKNNPMTLDFYSCANDEIFEAIATTSRGDIVIYQYFICLHY